MIPGTLPDFVWALLAVSGCVAALLPNRNEDRLDAFAMGFCVPAFLALMATWHWGVAP